MQTKHKYMAYTLQQKKKKKNHTQIGREKKIIRKDVIATVINSYGTTFST